MGYYRCKLCGLVTGDPSFHSSTDHEPDWFICTCGSGGHPRRCNNHPGAYEHHIQELDEITADELELEKNDENCRG